MNKKTLFILVALVLAVSLSLTGCTAMKAASQAREMLDEYFEYYNDIDIDECIDMFGDEIIDDFETDDVDGEDMAETVLNGRRYLLGEVDDYEVVSMDSDGAFGSAQVVFLLEVEYENQDDPIEEEYLFVLEDGDMEIAGFEFDDQTVTFDLIDEYFENLNDMETLKDLYIPYVVANLFDEASMTNTANSANAAGGEFKGFDPTYFSYEYMELDWDDDIFYIVNIEGELEFENDIFWLYAEFSSEDDEVGFNYVEYYPLNVINILEDYYAAAGQKDTAAMMNIYKTGFFEGEDFTAADWQEGIFVPLVNDYGDFIDYSIYAWEYTTATYQGQEVAVYSVMVEVEYEGSYFEEYFVILPGVSSNAVIGHQIY